MNEFDTHTFRLAVAQFNEAAESMRLDTNLRERLDELGLRQDSWNTVLLSGQLKVGHPQARFRVLAQVGSGLLDIRAHNVAVD